MKSVSARTRRLVLSRETIGPVIGRQPIWLRRAGLGRLPGRRNAATCSVGRRTGRGRRAVLQAAFSGWPGPGSTEDVGSLAASFGGVSFAPAPRSGARDARSR